MIQGTAKLVVDLGNSETRVITMFGKNSKTGALRRKSTKMRNRYAEYNPRIALADPVNETNSYKFHATGIVDGDDIDGEFLSGLIVDREYAHEAYRPTATKKKYNNITTLLGLHLAFLEGYRAIASIHGVGIEEVDVDWQVTVLLPPEDVDSGQLKIAETIRSIREISFSMPEVTKEIRIVDGGISVIPEGFAAFMGVTFLPGQKFREGYEHLMEDSVLIMDIGAGTTDFTVIEAGNPLEKTKFTENIGGNNVANTFRQIYNRDEGVKLTDRAAHQGVVQGTVRDGASTVDVTEKVAEAKSVISRSLVNSLADFFETAGYNPRQINQLLVVGGGAQASEVEGIKPIAEYLVKEMRTYSPHIGLVDLPMEEKLDKETGKRIKSMVSPRNLNIKGAAILSE